MGLNIRLKGFVYRNIYTPLDRGMVLLQYIRWKFSHKANLLVYKFWEGMCFGFVKLFSRSLLQRGGTVCNAERCISHGNSICLSCWYPSQTNEDRITQSSLLAIDEFRILLLTSPMGGSKSEFVI